MTPEPFAARLVADLELTADSRVLEPSFGEGAFLVALIERFDVLLVDTIPDPADRLAHIVRERLWGVELDAEMYQRALANIESRFGSLPEDHNLVHGDFFDWVDDVDVDNLDHVVGNPPFGGTFNPRTEDALDRRYGRRCGHKIKKETYAFFIVASTELLRDGGMCTFICSDTFRTISTMAGLRRHLVAGGSVELATVEHFSDETDYPMVVLRWEKAAPSGVVTDGVELDLTLVAAVPTFSFGARPEFAPYFTGPRVGDYLVCTGGMTTGANTLFVRDIHTGDDGERFVIETHDHRFVDEPITLEREQARARLHKLSPKRTAEVAAAETAGETRREVRVEEKPEPVRVEWPHDDYAPYNMMCSGALVYTPWRKAIFWRDDGDAVLTWKKTGNWYLHGVGGRRFFRREGITWNLISDTIEARYLPAGAILDSGAPCGFLRDGVDTDELYVVLGWLLTGTATRLLREVLNHTRNVQSKDIERLPYPFWLNSTDKQRCVAAVKGLVAQARAGKQFVRGDESLVALDDLYAHPTAG